MLLTRRHLLTLIGGATAASLLPLSLGATREAFALGSDRFVGGVWRELAGKRLGLLTNQTGLLSNGTPLMTVLHRHAGVKLRALFSPEHGLYGTHAADERVGTQQGPSGVPVFSLYGTTRKPTPAMLDDIDVILVDIQDVGARTYTYISTLALLMQAAGEQKKAIWVLDRPNPIGGTMVEGPVLEPSCSSFIGLYPLAMRHGMTIGEVATFYRDFCGISVDLTVVPMSGYDRSMLWSQTHLRWIPTSPHVPSWETAFFYLTTGPLGAAGINGGIDTPTPFAYALHPRIDADALALDLIARDLPGLAVTPVILRPTTGYWEGKSLNGVRLHLVDPTRYETIGTALALVAAFQRLAPNALFGGAGLDHAWGTTAFREAIRERRPIEELQASWQSRLTAFLDQRRRVLIY